MSGYTPSRLPVNEACIHDNGINGIGSVLIRAADTAKVSAFYQSSFGFHDAHPGVFAAYPELNPNFGQHEI